MTSTQIAFIHTSPSMIPVFKSLTDELLPKSTTIFNMVDESLLCDIIREGCTPAKTARRLVNHVIQADDAGAQEQADAGQQGRDDPHDRVDALDRHTEERGAIGALGARAHRDADVRVAEERGESDDRDRHRDHRQDVVAAEHGRSDREREVERRREVLRRRPDTERTWQGELGAREHRREADGDDREDQPRRLEEAAHEHELDERAEQQRGTDS